MNFTLDVLYTTLQSVLSALFSSVFLTPLTILTETIIRIFTGGA
jgi:hypothetical protein